MKTLIIPCCGKTMIEDKPNWLARHPNGKFLIEECITALPVEDFDRIVIPILKEDNKAYYAEALLRQILSNVEPYPEIVLLEHATSSPAETIYVTIKKANIVGPIVIRDSDVKLKVGSIKSDNFIVGLDLMNSKTEIPDIRKKAFIIVNENNIILDIIEKQISSSHVCYGMYGIHCAQDFVTAYEALSDPMYGIQQLFVSNIIAYLIGAKNQIYHYVVAEEYEDWDNAREWLRLEKRFGTYFVNLDMLTNENDFKSVYTLQEKGAKLVFFTNGSRVAVPVLEKELTNQGICDPILIVECNYGEISIIKSINALNEKIMEII